MTAASKRPPHPDRDQGTISVPGYRARLTIQSGGVAGVPADEAVAGRAFDEPISGRMAWETALPLILLLSLSFWAVILTAVVWLYRVTA